MTARKTPSATDALKNVRATNNPGTKGEQNAIQPQKENLFPYPKRSLYLQSQKKKTNGDKFFIRAAKNYTLSTEIYKSVILTNT